MPLGLIFWVLMLLWICFGLGFRSGNAVLAGFWYVDAILLFVLFFILGWHDFGFIVSR
jgi:hypothetical protein